MSRWRAFAASIGLIVIALSCRDETSGPSTGSESHFLRACAASCEAGFECLCGVCTRPCDQTEQCQPLYARSECVALADRPPESACYDPGVAAFCDVRCSGDDECNGLGEGFACRDGFCRDGDSTSIAQDGRIELSELCEFYVTHACDTSMQCYGWAYANREQCLRTQECDGWPDLTRLLEESLATYDPVLAYDCHQRLLLDPCSLGLFLGMPDLPTALRVCGALIGQLPQGAACTRTGECGTRTTCDLSAGCPGVCSLADRGEKQSGEACIPALCPPDDPECGECASELVCDQNVCRPPWIVGEACTQLIDCGTELWCNVTLGSCERQALLGELCSDFREAAPRCSDGLWCDGPTFETGVCRTISALGEACDDDSACVEGATCLPDPVDPLAFGICVVPQPNGSRCDSYADCQSYLCATDVCAPQPVAGEPCVDECADGFSCVSSVCEPLQLPGEPCDPAIPCQLSRCIDGVCTFRGRLGTACGVDDDCLSGHCVGGSCADPVGCD